MKISGQNLEVEGVFQREEKGFYFNLQPVSSF